MALVEGFQGVRGLEAIGLWKQWSQASVRAGLHHACPSGPSEGPQQQLKSQDQSSAMEGLPWHEIKMDASPTQCTAVQEDSGALALQDLEKSGPGSKVMVQPRSGNLEIWPFQQSKHFGSGLKPTVSSVQ